MTKVLFMLSAVVMVVAIVISYQNRQTLVDMRLKRIETDTKLKRERDNVERLAGEAKAAGEKVAAANAEVSQEDEKMSIARNKLTAAQKEAEALQKAVDESQAKIAEYKRQVEELTKTLPENFSIETVAETMNAIKAEIATSKGQVEKVQEQLDGKDAELKRVQDQLSDVTESIDARRKSFERNSLSAVVVAVNNDWGFVIIEGGQNKGITGDAKLLVVRGSQPIGRLNVVSVDQNKTLANIDLKSLQAGLTVAPGDRVILETLYQ